MAWENATVPWTTNGETTLGRTCLSATTQRGPERPHGLHVLLLALGQDGAAHDAGEERRVDDGDGDDRAVHAGAAHGRDADGEEQAGDAEEDVHHAVDGVVPGAAEIAGGEPERAAEQHGDADGRRRRRRARCASRRSRGSGRRGRTGRCRRAPASPAAPRSGRSSARPGLRRDAPREQGHGR